LDIEFQEMPAISGRSAQAVECASIASGKSSTRYGLALATICCIW